MDAKFLLALCTFAILVAVCQTTPVDDMKPAELPAAASNEVPIAEDSHDFVIDKKSVAALSDAKDEGENEDDDGDDK